MLSYLGSAFDLLLVILGFGLIIFFHELGHFLAARWAGIRVLAFAVGFGPALVSWRRGMGLRKGSSAGEYIELAKDRGIAASPDRPPLIPGVSPTEYRLNILPFGGYVKMLGQDDADPSARSDALDGYQSAPPWKRMIVISAGVVANFIIAALLFIIVFMAGLKTEPAVIGNVAPGSPAATTAALNAKDLGVTEPGLKPGDRVLSINADEPADFSELVVATAMARKGRAIRFVIDRPGLDEHLTFDITPRVDPVSKLLQIGVGPAVSATLHSPDALNDEATLEREMNKAGLGAVPTGSTLTRIGASDRVVSAFDLEVAARRSGGEAFDAVFSTPGAGELTVPVQPQRRLLRQEFWPAPDRLTDAAHVLGLLPVLKVELVNKNTPAADAGLQDGDIFVQIGSAEWPSYPEGIAQVKSNAGAAVRIVVLRQVDGVWREVDLGSVRVKRDGTIGFYPGEVIGEARVTSWPASLTRGPDASSEAPIPSGARLALMRGSRILRVNDTPVSSFDDLVGAIIDATRSAYDQQAATADVSLSVALPMAGSDNPPVETIEWSIPRDELKQLHELSWSSPIPTFLFEPQEIVLKASSPMQAITMGISRTHRVMMQTYLTFSRLFQGSVKVEHLRGPVGIAHLGTMVASRGFIHLLFFMALISVNLGVVNFLPIPIADGGHFVFLLHEQITGKPVSVAVQNIATLAGLILIASLFLLVTYNDITSIFG